MKKKHAPPPAPEGICKTQVDNVNRITDMVSRTLMNFEQAELEEIVGQVETMHLKRAKTEEEKACIRYTLGRVRANRASSFLEPRAGRTKMDICMELMAARGMTWEEACAEWQRGGQ